MRYIFGLALALAVAATCSCGGSTTPVTADLQINALESGIFDVCVNGACVLEMKQILKGESLTVPEALQAAVGEDVEMRLYSRMRVAGDNWTTQMRTGDSYRIDYYGWWDPAARGSIVTAHAWSADW